MIETLAVILIYHLKLKNVLDYIYFLVDSQYGISEKNYGYDPVGKVSGRLSSSFISGI
jgi:hypothetical protein